MPKDFWKVCKKYVQQVLVLLFCKSCLLLLRKIIVVTQLQQLMHQFCVCARSPSVFESTQLGIHTGMGKKE